MLFEEFKYLLYKIGIRNWGICDISSFSHNSFGYTKAISLFLPYKYSILTYNENTYYNLLVQKRIEIEKKY